MEVELEIPKKVLYPEQVMHAERIINLLKDKAAEFDSDDPKHKHGRKYIISKKRYNHIITLEICQLPEEIRTGVTEIIERKLIKV